MVNQRLRSAAILLVLVAAVPLFGANPPVLLTIDPQTVIAGTGSFTLSVTGANLTGATLRVNGTPRTTTVISDTALTATITSSDILNPATLQITVANSAGSSSALQLFVLPNSPTITSLAPSSLPVHSSSLNVTVNGQNFASTAVVLVNGSNRVTAYVDSSQLTLTLLPADVGSTATLNVRVRNPNAQFSNTVSLSVAIGGTAPTITLISPNSVVAASPGFTLSVVGTNFVSGSVVRVNGIVRTTTFVDASHLTAAIPASDIVNPGTLSITVLDPDATVSAPATLTVSAAGLPVINSISPSTVTVGAALFTLTISGSNFVNGSTVQVGTSSRAATFVDATRLTVGIATTDVLTVGQVSISVTTPQPHVATSNQVILYVVALNAPTITSISPQNVQAGTPDFTLLINGANFLFDDFVQVNGSARTTQFISATQLAAAIPAADIATSGTLAVTVSRHDGSAVSAPIMLTVADASLPSIASFNPASANVGDAPFTLAILGHNFTTSSIVTFDTTPRATQFVSATELDISVAAADLTTPRLVPVQIVNPGGVVSPVVLFPVVIPVPTIATLTPASVISGDAGFQLVVTGTNFSTDSVININGSPRTTQLQSATGALTTNVDASEISAPGALSVTVSRNGGASAPANLAILRPTITSVNPTVIVIGSPSVTLNVQGSAFLSISAIVFKGSDQPTTFNPDGSLTATIDATTLTDPGQYAVVVKNSPSSSSTPFLIEVQAPGTPQIASVAPSSIAVGSGVTTIQLSGANFVPLSVVTVNGSDRVTIYVAGNVLQADLMAQDISAPGTLHVAVRNPGGATSAEALVTVTGTSVIPPRRRVVGH